jgi:glycosyltransferase involved in cell wall biosynthesis
MIPRRAGHPRICLNMIVRDEAHIVHELIDAVAASIDSWVIVDTGSTDGTQDLIRRLMAERGIPGELHERPWRNFGHNRSEAIALARGHADYIWVMDADDTVSGRLDFSRLAADAYSMRIADGANYWRLQLFRDGLPWYYTGVLHEVAVCDVPYTKERLEGD